MCIRDSIASERGGKQPRGMQRLQKIMARGRKKARLVLIGPREAAVGIAELARAIGDPCLLYTSRCV